MWGPQASGAERDHQGDSSPVQPPHLSLLSLTQVPVEKLISCRNYKLSYQKDSDILLSSLRCPREVEMMFPSCQTPGAGVR